MKRIYILTVLILLMAGTGWAYDIIIGDVTVTSGSVAVATVEVHLLTSGVTMYTKSVSAKINQGKPSWKITLRNELKTKVLGVNTSQMTEDTWQSGVADFKSWLKGQVE